MRLLWMQFLFHFVLNPGWGSQLSIGRSHLWYAFWSRRWLWAVLFLWSLLTWNLYMSLHCRCFICNWMMKACYILLIHVLISLQHARKMSSLARMGNVFPWPDTAMPILIAAISLMKIKICAVSYFFFFTNKQKIIAILMTRPLTRYCNFSFSKSWY